MSPLRARVEKGRLVLDEPTTLPEGSSLPTMTVTILRTTSAAFLTRLTRDASRPQPDHLHRRDDLQLDPPSGAGTGNATRDGEGGRWPAIAVERGDVELHQLDAAAKPRQLGLRRQGLLRG